MFTIQSKNNQKLPIKVWLRKESDLEESCLEQAINLSNLPFAYKHIVLLPDTHTGYGMPIGGVLASKGAIVPNAVGVDIGCGMVFVSTNVPSSLLREVDTPNGKLGEQIIGTIMRNIPVGFEHYKTKQPCQCLDNANRDILDQKELLPEIESGYYQVGTLGGGNHFIELQEDENGLLCIMIHSVSRNFGYKICNYFNAKAKELKKKWQSEVPSSFQLDYLPTDDYWGQSYIAWMNLALQFAAENRDLMIKRVTDIVCSSIDKYTSFENIELSDPINAHHNYAALEQHFGEEVWVHRKGAIRAGKDELGIIPGAMGSYSYIVRGLGSKESFESCSHGAGRRMGRKQALREFNVQQVIEDFKAKDIFFGKHSKKDAPEEFRLAYKDIDDVIRNEIDLVDPIKRLKTVAVVKG